MRSHKDVEWWPGMEDLRSEAGEGGEICKAEDVFFEDILRSVIWGRKWGVGSY